MICGICGIFGMSYMIMFYFHPSAVAEKKRKKNDDGSNSSRDYDLFISVRGMCFYYYYRLLLLL